MWMQTAGCRKFLINCTDPNEIDFDDIATSLSNLTRFVGHTPFYSVAQHSVMVSDRLLEQGHGNYVAMYGLLHDAHEAYLGDISRPLKFLLARQGVWHIIQNLVDRLTDFCYYALAPDWPILNEDEIKYVKDADNAMLVAEARNLYTEIVDNWILDVPVNVPWNGVVYPMTPTVARTVFVARYEKLLREGA